MNPWGRETAEGRSAFSGRGTLPRIPALRGLKSGQVVR